jgi:hypothetical protein
MMHEDQGGAPEEGAAAARVFHITDCLGRADCQSRVAGQMRDSPDPPSLTVPWDFCSWLRVVWLTVPAAEKEAVLKEVIPGTSHPRARDMRIVFAVFTFLAEFVDYNEATPGVALRLEEREAEIGAELVVASGTNRNLVQESLKRASISFQNCCDVLRHPDIMCLSRSAGDVRAIRVSSRNDMCRMCDFVYHQAFKGRGVLLQVHTMQPYVRATGYTSRFPRAADNDQDGAIFEVLIV